MANRIESALSAWRQRQEGYSALYGPAVMESRDFAKIRLSEMRRLYREHRPPRSRDERVSLALLRAANRCQERSLYRNRIIRYGRKLIVGVARVGRRIIGGMAEMMRDPPTLYVDPLSPRGPEKTEIKAIEQTPAQRSNVVRMQPRRRYQPRQNISKSKGIRR